MFKNAQEAIRYIESKRTKRTFLDFKNILEKYNISTVLPHVIHVAGTNGKGSTTTFIRDLLMKHGYRVGTFTSPYIVCHNERISVNGKAIEDSKLLEIICEIYPMIEKENLSMFEIDVVIMLIYFRELNLDYHIIECGIGGKNDKTNVIQSELALITNIGYDHQFMLGNTLEEIADHKLGIVKDGVTLYSSEHNPKIVELFKIYCKNHQSKCCIVDVPRLQYPYRLIYQNEEYIFNLPAYQIGNALLALNAVSSLIALHPRYIQEVFDEFLWPCRFEYVKGYYLDGAHNIDGIRALIQTLEEGCYENVGIVFSALDDKDVTEMLALLKDYDVEFAGFEDERLMSQHLPFPQVLKEMKEEHETVVVTGSLHFVSQVRAYLLNE